MNILKLCNFILILVCQQCDQMAKLFVLDLAIYKDLFVKSDNTVNQCIKLVHIMGK